MVHKLTGQLKKCQFPFENDVELYGTQTTGKAMNLGILFENDVELYGTQTKAKRCATLA